MSGMIRVYSTCLIVTLASTGLALSKSDPNPRGQSAFICGTSAARERDVLARGQYHNDRLMRLRAKGQFPLSLSNAAVQTDVGDVAILEDDGTLISDANPFNLRSQSFLFQPVGVSSYRVVKSSTAFNSSGGTRITLEDDGTSQQNLGNPGFTFFGKTYTSVQVNSDGNLTFGEADTAHTARDLGRFSSGPPRIGPFFTDLDPSRGGVVSVRTDFDGMQFSWDRVPQFSDTSVSQFNSFSVKLMWDGSIEFSYGATVDSQDAIVGVSPGNGTGGIHAINYLTDPPVTFAEGTIAEVFASTTTVSESAIAKKFFETHPDHFDHLNLFLGFDYDLGGGAYAYEVNVKNEILGIGLATEDHSTSFGSNGRLRSFLNMGTLSGFNRYPDDPNLVFLGTNSTMGIMGQESGHRWLAFTPFRDGTVNSNTILGRDDAHWSFFYNSEGSVMEGNKIQDQGAGQGAARFLTVAATYTYSPLDQYIIGLRSKDEVPPSFLVENPFGTSFQPFSNPRVGVSFGGTRKDISVDDIIAANGVRQPSVFMAPKVFRQGFIYLVKKGQTAQPDQIRKVQTIRDAWVDFFNGQTGNRGWIVTDLQDTPGTTPSHILFPFFQGNTRRYTGVALANWGSKPADVHFSAYSNNGQLLTSPPNIINPRTINIPPGAQIAQLGEQIFGLSLSDPRNGWIQADSTSSEVTGFFLDGDVPQTLLAGAVAGSQTSTTLYFTRAQLSSASSPGNSYRNLIDVVNPTQTKATLAFRLIDEFGNLQATATRTLSPQGRMAEDLPSLFPASIQPRANGYISLTSNVGVVGYQSIDSGSTIFALPALVSTSATTIYSAQFASGGNNGIQYFSDLNFINTATQNRRIQVLLVGNNGQPVVGIQNPVIKDLSPGQQIRVRGETFFGLPDAARALTLTEGSLVVTADGPGVLGDVTFGDPVAGRFLASLPLDGNPTSNFVFSQVAQGNGGGTKPYFTGIALYNPGPGDVSVTVNVFSERGDKTGSGTFLVGSGSRLSQTLPQYIPAISEQVRGYIRISTTGGPIVAFELFGGQALEFLAAVPPQPINP